MPSLTAQIEWILRKHGLSGWEVLLDDLAALLTRPEPDARELAVILHRHSIRQHRTHYSLDWMEGSCRCNKTTFQEAGNATGDVATVKPALLADLMAWAASPPPQPVWWTKDCDDPWTWTAKGWKRSGGLISPLGFLHPKFCDACGAPRPRQEGG